MNPFPESESRILVMNPHQVSGYNERVGQLWSGIFRQQSATIFRITVKQIFLFLSSKLSDNPDMNLAVELIPTSKLVALII